MTTAQDQRQATDRFATVEGVRLHYNDVGSGPVLFTFHGGGPGANGWDNTKWNIPGLSPHLRLLLTDMPGYGQSDKQARPKGEFQDVWRARLLRGLMDELGIERAHFYGSSASGPAVLRFGIEYPERVGKIILQSAGVIASGIWHATPPDGIVALNVFRREPTRANMERMMRLFIPKPELCTEELIEARFQAATIPGHIEAMNDPASGQNSPLVQDIGRLQAPVLVVWGQQDRMVPLEGVWSALNFIPNVRAHIWGGGTGHFVAYEQTEEFNKLVLDFLLR